MRNSSLRLAAAALALSLGLAACSDNTEPRTDPLTAQNAQTVGAAAASTADLALVAINPMVPSFGNGFPLLFAAGRPLAPRPGSAPPATSPPEGCPAASSLTDTDNDGVPDDATWTYTAELCTETDIEGNSTVITGSVGLSDPGLTAGYDLDMNSLTASWYENGATTPAARLAMDGQWALRGTSDALSLGQHYNFALTVGSHSAVLANTLDVSFDAAAGDIAWGAPLPDGTLSIDGAWQVDA
ncbi:MAG TPA: hypothetical protein PK948_12445, partial [Gemmatimonadales bacterium]|nr:hypothetical protein [Gemmatimonadales bacterium]